MQLEDMLLSFHTNSRTVPHHQAMIIFFRVLAYSLFATSPVTVNSLNYWSSAYLLIHYLLLHQLLSTV